MSAMAEDPQVAANLARLFEETGYPQAGERSEAPA